jgi:uncharacterized protein YndB with AHSA1/START domain
MIGMRSRAGRTLLAASLVMAWSGTQAAAQEVENTSYRTADGGHVLQHRIVIPASLDSIWWAFTTTEGVQSWAVPLAHVDFRLGGIWESSYQPGARIGDAGNIRNRFISFLPRRMISMQAIDAPPGFPHPDLLPELFTVMEFQPLGEAGVRVTVSGVGYRTGQEYDAIRSLFDQGNAWSLQQLHRRFTKGAGG